MLPVSTRVRLKIRPTASHARNESITRAGWPKGAKERTKRSKPLPQCSCSGAMLALAKKCRIANSGAVSSTALKGPDSRSIAVCMAPRNTVSSIRATLTPDAKPASSRRDIPAADAVAADRSRRANALPAEMRRRRRRWQRRPRPTTGILSRICARAGRSRSRVWRGYQDVGTATRARAPTPAW